MKIAFRILIFVVAAQAWAQQVPTLSVNIASRNVVLDEHTARPFTRVLAGYLRYLYDVEQVRGTPDIG